jgi:hypothetical protein
MRAVMTIQTNKGGSQGRGKKRSGWHLPVVICVHCCVGYRRATYQIIAPFQKIFVFGGETEEKEGNLLVIN